MTALHHDTLVRIGDDPRRWLWLGLCALGGVLVCTAVLGSVLAPRWPDAWSWSALKTGWQARMQADVRSEPVQPDSPAPATLPTVTLATPVPAEPTAPPSVRPKAYSSVDTQTIAEARAHQNVPAGQSYASASVPPALARENDDAIRAPAVSTPLPPPPASTAADAPRPSRPSVTRSPTVVAPPQGVARAGGELALLDPRVGTPPPRRSTPSSEMPAGGAYRANAPRVYPSPVDRAPPEAREATRETTSVTQRSVASLGRPMQPYGPPAGASPVPPSARQDPVALQLDELWERRERWLRERLQARNGQR